MIREATTATVLIGTRESVLDALTKLYPIVEKSDDLANTEYFWTDMPFDKQIEKLLTFNKYKSSHFVYGIIYFYQNKPESTLTDALKQIPQEVREFRVQRVEIHR